MTEITDAQIDAILEAADPAYLSARRVYKPAWRSRMRAALAAYEGGRAQRKSSSKAPPPEELAQRLHDISIRIRAFEALYTDDGDACDEAAATIRDLKVRLELAERERDEARKWADFYGRAQSAAM